MGGFLSLLRSFRDLRKFTALPREQRRIVFYAEDSASWVHFEPILRELTGPLGRTVCYLTSEAEPPPAALGNSRLLPFLIGDGGIRSYLFLALEADVAVMTMPDLQTFHLKRSRAHPVHYVYVFHSMVSTHMIYRPGAFDHYDTILCAGPHHQQEIRATEKLLGLREKRLVPHGYGRLDTLIAEGPLSPPEEGTPRILVAPSWSPDGLIEKHGRELTGALLDAGYRVTLRPHPMTARRWPASLEAIRQAFGKRERFVLETDIATSRSLREAEVLISDWSGAALEYAFAFERPVLFVDVPRKVNNPGYARIGCEPLEVAVREKIGALVAPGDRDGLLSRLDVLRKERAGWSKAIRQVRDAAVFNLGSSGRAGAEEIARLADEAGKAR